MAMQHRRLAAAGLSCALTGALLAAGTGGAGAYATAGPSAAAAPATCSANKVAFTMFPEYRKFQDSRRLRTPVILHGSLTDTKGKPIRGAVLLAAGTSPGLDTVVPAAVNRTNAKGEYVLRTAMTRKLRAVQEGALMDVTMEVFTPGHRHLVWGTTVGWDTDRRAWKQATASEEGPATRAASARNRLNIKLDPRGGSDVSGMCIPQGAGPS
jgi:hypothetical protein